MGMRREDKNPGINNNNNNNSLFFFLAFLFFRGKGKSDQIGLSYYKIFMIPFFLRSYNSFICIFFYMSYIPI